MRRRPEVVEAAVPVPTWWAKVSGQLVIVHHDDERSFRGIVKEVLADGVVLAHAVLLQDEGPEVPLAGDYWIPHEKVKGVQTVPREKKATVGGLELVGEAG